MTKKHILLLLLIAHSCCLLYSQTFTARFERSVFEWKSQKNKKDKTAKYKITANGNNIFNDYLASPPEFFPNKNDNTCQFIVINNSNYQFAILNSKGEFVIPFTYGFVNSEITEKYKIYDLAIIVKKENAAYFSYAIDSSFKEIPNSLTTGIYSPPSGINNYSYLIQDPKSQLYGFFNFKEKRVIIPKRYKSITKLSVDNYANVVVLTDSLNKVSFCNDSLINYDVQDADKYIPTKYEFNNIVVFQKNNLLGFFNILSKKVTKEKFNYMQSSFTGNYTLVGIPGKTKYAYMKKNGEIVTEFEYDKYEYSSLEGFSDICESCILTKKNNLYGIVQDDGTILLPNKYKFITRFEELGSQKNSGFRRYGVLMVFSAQNNKGALFDLNGFPITDFLYEDFQQEGSYIMGKIGNTKQAFYYWDGTPVNYKKAQQSTTNNLIEETNKCQKDFTEKLDEFVKKWDDIADNNLIENAKKLKLFQQLMDIYKEELIALNNKILEKTKTVLENYTTYISIISKERADDIYEKSKKYEEKLKKLTPQYMLSKQWSKSEKGKN